MRICKREVVRRAARASGLTQRQVDAAYKAVLEVVLSEVEAGGQVCLNGFGSFFIRKHRPGHMGYTRGKNPEDGYLVFKFQPSESVNRRIRGLGAVHRKKRKEGGSRDA